MNFHSQYGEDRFIFENLSPPKLASFCEVGAFDGIASSNTLAFEEIGWSGLCVEADHYLAGQCQNNRKCEVMGCACGVPITGEDMSLTPFWVNLRDRGASGLDRPGEMTIHVPLVRLDFLINLLIRPAPWLLSIDTEGSELDVWESLGEIRPQVVVMEYRTFEEPPQDGAIIPVMTACGYREVHRTEVNLIFAR